MRGAKRRHDAEGTTSPPSPARLAPATRAGAHDEAPAGAHDEAVQVIERGGDVLHAIFCMSDLGSLVMECLLPTDSAALMIVSSSIRSRLWKGKTPYDYWADSSMISGEVYFKTLSPYGANYVARDICSICLNTEPPPDATCDVTRAFGSFYGFFFHEHCMSQTAYFGHATVYSPLMTASCFADLLYNEYAILEAVGLKIHSLIASRYGQPRIADLAVSGQDNTGFLRAASAGLPHFMHANDIPHDPNSPTPKFAWMDLRAFVTDDQPTTAAQWRDQRTLVVRTCRDRFKYISDKFVAFSKRNPWRPHGSRKLHELRSLVDPLRGFILLVLDRLPSRDGSEFRLDAADAFLLMHSELVWGVSKLLMLKGYGPAGIDDTLRSGNMQALFNYFANTTPFICMNPTSIDREVNERVAGAPHHVEECINGLLLDVIRAMWASPSQSLVGEDGLILDTLARCHMEETGVIRSFLDLVDELCEPLQISPHALCSLYLSLVLISLDRKRRMLTYTLDSIEAACKWLVRKYRADAKTDVEAIGAHCRQVLERKVNVAAIIAKQKSIYDSCARLPSMVCPSQIYSDFESSPFNGFGLSFDKLSATLDDIESACYRWELVRKTLWTTLVIPVVPPEAFYER